MSAELIAALAELKKLAADKLNRKISFMSYVEGSLAQIESLPAPETLALPEKYHRFFQAFEDLINEFDDGALDPDALVEALVDAANESGVSIKRVNQC